MPSYKKAILRSPQTLTLYPAVDKILNSIKAIKQVDRLQGGGGGGGTRGKDKKRFPSDNSATHPFVTTMFNGAKSLLKLTFQ